MPDGDTISASDVIDADIVSEETVAEATPEVPSVFSVTQRHLVGRVEVSPPAEDGSRVVRLMSGNGGSVIEANLSPQLCDFVAGKLVEVEVITQDDEEEDSNAGTQAD